MKEYAKSFYTSPAWKKCRLGYMQSKNFICERCGGTAHIVHHKKHINPQNIHDTSITLSWSNLEALCQDCHNKEHMTNNAICMEGLKFDETGNLVKG